MWFTVKMQWLPFVQQRISTKNIYMTKIFSSAIIQALKRKYILTM